MALKDSLSRQQFIINKLKRSRYSLSELQDSLAQASEIFDRNLNTSARTFQRDIADIRELFQIEIQYDRRENKYFIDEDDLSNEQNLRLLEAYETVSLLNLNQHFQEYLEFENRQSQGLHQIPTILQAIKNKKQIEFLYTKFSDEEGKKRIAEVLALKEFRYRWYLVALDQKDQKIKTFALDRIDEVHILREKVKNQLNFNPKEYLKYCFGVIHPDGEKPEKVILAFDKVQGKYIKTLPFHHSQKIIKDDKSGLIIELELFITQDLIIEILSLGENIKVLNPDSLKDEIEKRHKKAIGK